VRGPYRFRPAKSIVSKGARPAKRSWSRHSPDDPLARIDEGLFEEVIDLQDADSSSSRL
jgi:hypothetical protein